VRIRVLGGFAVEIDGTVVGPREWRLRRARHLVAMLALANGQRVPRERLLEALWPEQEPATATHNLHQAMYVARRALRHSGVSDLLTMDGDQVVLCPGRVVEVDAVVFEHRAAAALAADDAGLLAEVDDLYAGDLLPELPYSDWAVDRRTGLREAHHAVLVRLAETQALDGSTEASQLVLERVLIEDSVHEGAVRASMRLLARAGRRSAALERYEALRDALLEAYGTDPDDQSRQLFRELLTTQESIGATRGRLPSQATSFVGREGELRDVGELVRRARLVTLTGPGGCGKTRLAVEAARAAAGHHAQGAWFVDLGALSDGDLVPDVVANALELTPGAGPAPERSLAQQLRSWRALIVLDNCEHLLQACAELADTVLAACPGVHLLTTSREPLFATGEVTFRVPSLALPPVMESEGRTEEVPAERVAGFAAVQLFVDRAQQVRPEFALTGDNSGAVARLCRSLDGIPLAIELAAARVVLLEPGEIIQRLDQVLSVLTSGEPGRNRHATIRAVLDWSHDLLSAAEQILLHRLSCFAGSFDLPAVEAVCGGPPLGHDLIHLLSRLVDKSLVLVVRSPAGTRYRLLDTVRQFSNEKLTAAGGTDVAATRHCAHYLSVARLLDPDYGDAAQDDVLGRLEREHDNFRTAMRWSIEHEPDSALALAASLWRFWFLRCHVIEGGQWLDRVLEAAPGPSRARAQALVGLTGLNARRGLSDRIRNQAADAVRVMEQLDDPAGVALHQLVHASMVWATHDVAEAERLAAGVANAARALGRPELLAAATWLQAHCALTREDDVTADRLLGECLVQLGEVDPRCAPFVTVITPCVVLVPVAGRLVPSYEESLLVGRRVGTAQAIGFVLAAQAYAPRLRGDLGAACSAATRAVRQFEGLGDKLGRAQALNQLGCIARDERRFDDAASYLREAYALRHEVGDRRGEWMTRANAALSRSLQGDVVGGRDEAHACLAAFEAVEDQPSIANTLGLLGALALASGDIALARGWYSRAVTRLVRQSWPRIEAWYRILLAELSFEDGDPRAARPEADEAATLLRLQRSRLAQERLATLRRRLDLPSG
jgi:predicted ATPase/DNA-binding SARP family transcriptional activator/tetratricopeptide (TPR) repeat protein